MQLKQGTLLHGSTYKIERVLGQGSFGITYLAMHTALNKNVAIKEFFMKELNGRGEDGSITGMSDGSLSMDYARKFQKEALNLARLEHPNIVRVTDSFEDNGTFYYVMDYIEGENLNEYVKHNHVSQQEAVDIIRDVAKALMYMHEEKHMLHLDMKPGNVMRRTSDGHIFIIDFGLSKHYSNDGQPETSTTIGLGTPGYAPIEQANRAKNVEFRPTIDVYALGATFYKLLTRETPPAASELVSDDELLEENLKKHNIEGNLVQIVIGAMMPSVVKRTQTVRAFADSLNGLYETVSVETQPETQSYVIAVDNDEETLVGNSSVEYQEPEVSPTYESQEPNSKGTNFFSVIGECFRKSFTFAGRASRSEYWYFTLFQVLVSLVLIIVANAFATSTSNNGDCEMLAGCVGVVLFVFWLCSLPASISVMVRRLHDTEHSGWYYWVSLIPFGGFYLLYLMVQSSDIGSNIYDVEGDSSNKSKGNYKGFFITLIVAIIVSVVGLCYLGNDSNQERFCEAERILEGKVLGPKGTNAADSVYLPADTLSAFPVIKELAEEEYGPAMWYMALFTENGSAGIEQDSAAAVEMYEKAATQLSKEAQDGDMYAQCSLSLMYSNGDGVSKDDRLAFNWMTKAAEQGYDDAQDNLAYLYSYGVGVEENDAKAFEWWTKAAAQKHPSAMLALGKAYMNGNGTTENKQVALKYFTELANKEYVPAYYQLAEYYYGESDYTKAKTYYEKASNNSDCRGDFGLGILYMYGWGVQADVNTAISYLERVHTGWTTSSSYDNLFIGLYAQLRLADCYYEKKKYSQAFNLYKEIADVEEPAAFMKDAVAEAQYMVAVSYSWGNGCKQSYQKAESWRKKALANGYKES